VLTSGHQLASFLAGYARAIPALRPLFFLLFIVLALGARSRAHLAYVVAQACWLPLFYGDVFPVELGCLAEHLPEFFGLAFRQGAASIVRYENRRNPECLG